MPIIGVVGITGIAVFHGSTTAFEAGIKTGLCGYVALIVLYRVLLVLAPKFPQFILKEAGWRNSM
jgi:hypothetical protein